VSTREWDRSRDDRDQSSADRAERRSRERWSQRSGGSSSPSIYDDDTWSGGPGGGRSIDGHDEYGRGGYGRGGSDRGGSDRGGSDRGGSDRGGADRGGGSDRGSYRRPSRGGDDTDWRRDSRGRIDDGDIADWRRDDRGRSGDRDERRSGRRSRGDDRGEGPTPETGRWSARQDRWVPTSRSSDDTDYNIRRMDDTSEIRVPKRRPGEGRVLDHDDWLELPSQPALPSTPSSAAPSDPYWGAPSNDPAPRRRAGSGDAYWGPPPNPVSIPEPDPTDPYWGDTPTAIIPPVTRYTRALPAPPPPRPPRMAPPPRTAPPPIPRSPVPLPPPEPDPLPIPDREPRPQVDYRGNVRTPRRESESRPRESGAGYRTSATDTSSWRASVAARTNDDLYGDERAPAPRRAPQVPPQRSRSAYDYDTGFEREAAPAAPDDKPNYVTTAAATVSWFVLPAIAFMVWMLFLSTDPKKSANCNNPTGAGCVSPRAEALQTLFNHIPQIAIAAVVSILIALLIRRIATTWRTLTVGFASAVIGGGLSTVVFTVIGQ
jgi:hypothetical protein